MDLNNLSICIGPCLHLERWLFNYLVGDWRNCWQGCWTEKEQLDEEKRLSDPAYMPPPSSSGAGTYHSASLRNLADTMSSLEIEERAVSSGNESGSSGRNNSFHTTETRIRQSNDSRGHHAQQSSRNLSGSRNTRPSLVCLRAATALPAVRRQTSFALNIPPLNTTPRHHKERKPTDARPTAARVVVIQWLLLQVVTVRTFARHSTTPLRDRRRHQQLVGISRNCWQGCWTGKQDRT